MESAQTNDTTISASTLDHNMTTDSNSSLPPSSYYAFSMFNIVIVSITGRAMRRINRDFMFKCQYRGLSPAGSDPVAAALALRDRSFGVCTASLRRYAVLLTVDNSCNRSHVCISEWWKLYVPR